MARASATASTAAFVPPPLAVGGRAVAAGGVAHPPTWCPRPPAPAHARRRPLRMGGASPPPAGDGGQDDAYNPHVPKGLFAEPLSWADGPAEPVGGPGWVTFAPPPAGAAGGGGVGAADGGVRRPVVPLFEPRNALEALLRRKRAVADAVPADVVPRLVRAAAAAAAAGAARGRPRPTPGRLAATIREAAVAARRVGAPPPIIAGVCGDGSLATARQAVRPPADAAGGSPLLLPPAVSPFLATHVGAVAVAVQTDPHFFFGDPADLPRLAAVLPPATPLLDATPAVHAVEIYAAAAGGATAVTLPAAGWTAGGLAAAVRLAASLGLGAVVECGDVTQLDAALAAGPAAVLLATRTDDTLVGRLAGFDRLYDGRADALAAWGGVVLAEGEDGGDVGLAAAVAARADGIVVHMVGEPESDEHW